MEYIAVAVIAALAFGVFWLIDKGFTRLFRSRAQYKSGTAIRLNKRYCTIGIILSVLGVADGMAGVQEGWIMFAAGGVILTVGIGLIIYYLTFGIYYDADGFIYNGFGKKSITYTYGQIRGQLLYNSSGSIIVELHMDDGKTVHVNTTLENAYAFLDQAFAGWLKQTGTNPDECDFFDPENSCWFPRAEG